MCCISFKWICGIFFSLKLASRPFGPEGQNKVVMSNPRWHNSSGRRTLTSLTGVWGVLKGGTTNKGGLFLNWGLTWDYHFNLGLVPHFIRVDIQKNTIFFFTARKIFVKDFTPGILQTVNLWSGFNSQNNVSNVKNLISKSIEEKR